MLIRRSYGEVKGNHLDRFLAEYGPLCRWSEGEKTLYFPRGSFIRFGYCDAEGDVRRYQGQEFDVIAIDEATQLSEAQFNALRACLRGTSDRPRRMYLTCNPGGVGHAWVKRLFVDRDFRAGERAADYAFIPARVYDNPVLMEADPDYARTLEALPEGLRAAWLEGRWDIFAGQFFPEFDVGRHVCAPLTLPAGWRCFGAMDYGFDMLALLLLGVDEAGDLWVIRECCRPNLTLSEAGRLAVDFFGGELSRVEYVVASPDLWNRRQDSGRSGVEILSAVAGMPLLRAADDRRIPGWRALREYLGEGGPTLRIAAGCSVLIRSLAALRFDESRAEDAADRPHDITHAPEALRYAVMSRPPRPVAEVCEDFHFATARRNTYWNE